MNTDYSIKQYTLVYAALILLALSTWGLAHVALGPAWVNNVVALVIALAKATLVVAVFMSLAKSHKLTKLWALAALVWLAIMSTILGDYFTRGWDTLPHSWTRSEGRVAGSPAGGNPTPGIAEGR